MVESENLRKCEMAREQVRVSLRPALAERWRKEVKIVEEEKMMREQRVGKRGVSSEARQRL